jgi:uncharacterized protein
MINTSKYLAVKKSTLPAAGKGLFTKRFISKGEKIVEYKGKVTSWKEADHKEGKNLYIFYINRNYVIDADKNKRCLARYANDARGLSRIKGMSNNSQYLNENNRIFITATRDIAAGNEILVGYGKAYWEVIKKINS